MTSRSPSPPRIAAEAWLPASLVFSGFPLLLLDQGGVGRVCVNPVMTVWAASRGGGGGGQGAGLAWAQRQPAAP